jgi:hypothetical protein
MNKKSIKLIVISIILIFVSFLIISTNYEGNKFLIIKNTNFKNGEGIDLSSPNFSFTFSPQSKIAKFKIFDNTYECSYSNLEKAKIIINNKYLECIDSTLLIEKYSLDALDFEEVLKVVKNSSIDFTFSESRLKLQNSAIFQLELLILIAIILYIANYNSKSFKKMIQNQRNQKVVINLCLFTLIVLAIIIKNEDPNIRREMNYNQISTKGVIGTTQLSIDQSKTNFEIRNLFIDMEFKKIPEGEISIVGSKKLIDLVIDKDMINIQNIESVQNLNGYRLPHNCIYPCKINLSVLNNKSFIINVNSKLLLYAPIDTHRINLSDLTPISIRISDTVDEVESRFYVESLDLKKYSVYSLGGMITVMILLFYYLILSNSSRKTVGRSDKKL